METQYLEAVEHLDKDNKWKACEVAQYNLTDPGLSRYYRMKNLILVVRTSDDWYARARHLHKADKIWHTTDHSTKENETTALQALREIRTELDMLQQNSTETAPENVDKQRLSGDSDDDDDDARSIFSETEVFGDDSAASMMASTLQATPHVDSSANGTM